MVIVPVVITSSEAGLKVPGIITEIKNFKSIIKKKERKHDKKGLLGKAKVDTIDFLILGSKALIDSCINHDKFVPVNNVLMCYNEMKNELKKYWKSI